VLTAELDCALASALAAAGDLPFTAGTWRPAPGGDPVSYATSLVPELAARAGLPAPGLAAALAHLLSGEPWITAARLAPDGFLTIDVSPQALAASAAAMVASGRACADSEILAGTTAADLPLPDLSAEPGWDQAWREQAEAMTSRLAQAAGARLMAGPDQGTASASASASASAGGAGAGAVSPSPVASAVDYLGADPVRYWLARIPRGRVSRRGPPPPGSGSPFAAVQQAHAEAASTLRWAADLGIERIEPGNGVADLLASPAERALLGLLSFLPVRVAAAARRGRPDEIPRYLERVGEAWLECRQSNPALPFGGQAAPGEARAVSARLLLADAARTVLATGLALTGVMPAARM
jgi:arginyl-tRNA synthetase